MTKDRREMLRECKKMGEADAKKAFKVVFYELDYSKMDYPFLLLNFPKLDYFDIVLAEQPINRPLIRELIMFNFPCNQEPMTKFFIGTLSPYRTSGGLIRSYLTGTGKKPDSVKFYENLWQTDLKECINQMRILLPQPVFEEVSENYIQQLMEQFV